MTSSAEVALEAIHHLLQNYPRQHGYYLLRLMDITALRAADPDDERLCEQVFEKLDDKPWSSAGADAQRWTDFEVSREAAIEEGVAALVGGGQVGHSRDTIPPSIASAIAAQFDALFVDPKRYFVRLGLGDPKYVFSQGFAVINTNAAGCLIVVESD